MGEPMPRARAQRRYPPKGAIDRAVEAVRANGIHVASVTINPDGSIKLSAVNDPDTMPATLFDTLNNQGRL